MAEGTGFAGYGYTDSGGEKIAALIDMINGGGAGRAGQEFEGGGILSLIANFLASPYGSRDRGAASPASAPRPAARPAGGAPAPAPSGLPSLRGPAGGPPPAPAPSPSAATAPALRGPAGGPRPSAPAARPAPAMPTGGPGTFAPGSMPAEALIAATPPARPAPVPRSTPDQSLVRRDEMLTFEGFVKALGSRAEGVHPEVLRTAYAGYLTPYDRN